MFRIACVSLFAALTTLPAPSALAAGYPEKSIRILIPFSPGGGTDLLSRAIQPSLEKALGVGIIIDNRVGAGGTIGVTLAARAAPDGYTLLVTSASYTFAPGLYKKDLPYDAIKDFKPLTMLAQQPVILGVHPSMPVTSVKELIALARQRPKEIFHGHAGIGSNLHMTTELFKYMAKIKMTAVPYKGGGPTLIALITGEIQVSMMGILSSKPFRRSGQVRALAVTTKQRSPAVPDLPTIDESGVPGYDKGAWTGMFAQAAVPEPIIAHVYQAMVKVLKDPEAVRRLADDGMVAVANTPKDFTAFIHSEIKEWNKLIQ
ncbi:MAG: tripartite tricarboxylate transporter substrate binding protein, partial [Betaproteobacteria bacterium]|nr:tripartite tricarboxylate transporter substrate binding protein [Betaproteobacteria bacterium]